jgi:hypothetical protein
MPKIANNLERVSTVIADMMRRAAMERIVIGLLVLLAALVALAVILYRNQNTNAEKDKPEALEGGPLNLTKKRSRHYWKEFEEKSDLKETKVVEVEESIKEDEDVGQDYENIKDISTYCPEGTKWNQQLVFCEPII